MITLRGETEQKYLTLKEILRECGSAAVAFSGGVDSTFLLKTAHEVLGERAAAITGSAVFFPEREQREAAEFCAGEGIRQIVTTVDMAELPGFAENPPDRCYHCKKALFARFMAIAEENGFACVVEGSNLDDVKDYRPGRRAIAELGIRSPLKEAGLTKEEIRALSRRIGLGTWNKPSCACLASRIAYGERISEEKLRLVGRAEAYLAGLGFRQVRVRLYEMSEARGGEMAGAEGHATAGGGTPYKARIEVEALDISRLTESGMRENVDRTLRSYGFSEITVDPDGYRTGSMNEALTEEERRQALNKTGRGEEGQP